MIWKWMKHRVLLATLLAGACIPVTISCDPGYIDAWIEPGYYVYDDCWDCDDDDGFFFDFWHYDDD